MGSRGPVPKAVAGRARTSASGVPPAPDYLTDEAKKEYDRLAALMAGTLQHHDQGILASHAQAVADIASSNRQMAEDGGMILKGAEGGKYMHPAHSIRASAYKLLLSTAAQLGLSPASRARMLGGGPAAPSGDGEQPGPAAFTAAHGGAESA